MASVNFLLRSTKKNDPFTVRLQFNNPEKISDKNPFGLDFVETKTEIYVYTPDEVLESPLFDGKKFWSKYKKYKGKDLHIMNTIVRALNNQKELRDYIISNYEADFKNEENPNKAWLTSTVKKYYDELKKKEDKDNLSETPVSLIWHFENYIKLKRHEIRRGTILKLENTKNIIFDFQKYQSSIKGYNVNYSVSEVNPEFMYHLEEYLKDIKLFSHNTIVKTIKIIRTICNFSRNYGMVLHPMYDLVKKPYEDTDIVYLSFSELKTIKNCDKIPTYLEDARDWLYISCFLGQRISDFMKFTKNMIRKDGEDFFIDFTQVKTDKKISLPLHPEVIDILQKRDMDFPDSIVDQIYNKQIKEVCKLAGIDEMTNGTVLKKVKEDGTWRYVKGKYEKWELIGSHTGRKSYCTNFYSKMPTSLILEVSGHTEERTLLAYIGKKDNTNAKLITNFYANIDITQD